MLKKIFWSGASCFALGVWLVAAAFLFGFAGQFIWWYAIPAYALLIYGFTTFLLPWLCWSVAHIVSATDC